MNAGKTILAIARPAVALVLLGALATVGGCDRHHHRHINYYNDGGYYGDVAVYRAPPVVVVPRDRFGPPPVFRDRDGGRHFDHRR